MTYLPYDRFRPRKESRMNQPSREIAGGENGLVFDIVCGQVIDSHKTALCSYHDGRTYYFCSESCKRLFDADPQRYLKTPSYGPFH